MSDFKITGGCHCGENRFEIRAPALDTHHCQCSICRKLQGTAFVTLSIFPSSAFTWTLPAKLDTFNSSSKVHRHRCKKCGTPLTITLDHLPDSIVVTRSSLDDGMEPGHPEETLRHAFWPNRVTWIEIKDDLPKCNGFA
jgi:hypothetical protein